MGETETCRSTTSRYRRHRDPVVLDEYRRDYADHRRKQDIRIRLSRDILTKRSTGT